MWETIKQNKDNYLKHFTGHNPREMFYKSLSIDVKFLLAALLMILF